MISMTEPTFTARIYLSGPIEVAKQILRKHVHADWLCVTIEPTLFIYTGGEESGYVVGLLNYPRFPSGKHIIQARADLIADLLLEGTFQHSALIVTPDDTRWITTRTT